MDTVSNQLRVLGDRLQPLLLLVIRLIWGGFFVKSGVMKLINYSDVVEYFADLGIAFASVVALATALVHLVCGVMFVAGYHARLASLPLAITMVGAFLTAHVETLMNVFREPGKFFCAIPFLFLFTCIIIFVFGPGCYSVDRWRGGSR